MDVVLVSVLGACFGAGAGALAGFLLLRNSGPVVTAAALAELQRLRMEWSQWKLGAEGVLESLDEVSDVIERKRRRIAARESKENAGVGSGGPTDLNALRARARAAGHPV